MKIQKLNELPMHCDRYTLTSVTEKNLDRTKAKMCDGEMWNDG